MGRIEHIVVVCLVAFVLLAAAGPACLAAEGKGPGKGATVTLYTTSDLHEHSEPLVRIAGYVRQQKKADPNTLLLDAGDFLNKGEKALAATEGEGMVAIMTAAGYDSCGLGNHDYMYSRTRIFELVAKFPGFPLTLGNVRWHATDKARAKAIPRYRIFQLKGVKVAVIGTGAQIMNNAPDPQVPAFGPAEALAKLVPELRTKADIIVMTTHQGDPDDRDLIEASGANAPDVLIGSHSHGRFVRRIGKTLFIKAGFYGGFLGKVTITWDGKTITSCKGTVMPVRKDWPQDAKTKAVRGKYVKPSKPKPRRKAA